MAAAHATLVTTKIPETDNIIDFSPSELGAPFVLRCAALSIDYLLLLIIPAGWLVFGKLMGEGTSVSIGRPVWLCGIVVFVGNFVILPLARGQSFGKMLTGLTIVNIDGSDPGVGRLLIRNTVGYAITILTGGLGFVIAALNSSGRTLHDLLTGTILVHGKKTLR